MEFDESVLIRRSDGAKLTDGSTGVCEQLTLHCAQCNTVLCDSAGVCGEVNGADSVVCSRVTNDVIVTGAMESGDKGELANCAVGKVVHSAPSHLATIRSLFLLCKANLNCYILDSSSVVKASTLSFDLKPLSSSMDEAIQNLRAYLDQMSCIKSRLADRSVSSESDK